jgi:hypothetical protein
VSVPRALEAAAIPLERTGGRRVAGLSDPERRLYTWILSRFAAARRPSMEQATAAGRRLRVDVERALETFARLDLVHLADGEIAVAYPFSGRATPHRVRIDGGHEVFAMCALDALGIAPMLELPIEILSRDPISHGEVWVRIDPGDGAWWEPGTAVVLAGSSCRNGPSFRTCCGVLNFFESRANAGQYLVVHPEVSGYALSLPEAIETGSAIFGDLLKEVRDG